MSSFRMQKIRFFVFTLILVVGGLPYSIIGLPESTQNNTEFNSNTPSILTENKTISPNPLLTKSSYQFGTWNWTPFGSDPTVGRLPEIYIKFFDSYKIVITAKFYGMWSNTVNISNVFYTILDVPGCGHLSEPEQPELPFTSRFLEIPSEVEITPHIINYEARGESSTAYPLKAVINPYFPGSSNIPDDPVVNGTIYSSSAWFPNHVDDLVNLTGASKSDERIIRGHRYLAIEFVPVQYHPQSQNYTVYSLLEVELRFNQRAWLPVIDPSLQSQAFEEIFQTFFMGYNQMERRNSTSSIMRRAPLQLNDGFEYLIITADQFEIQANDFADWKRERGIITQVMTLTDIRDAVNEQGTTIEDDRESIQTYIKVNLRTDYRLMPEYALIIGDSDHIPSLEGDFHTDLVTPNQAHQPAFRDKHIGTDLFYFTLDGEQDIDPDILFGRFSVNTTADLTAIITKTKAYVDFPSQNPNFYGNVTKSWGPEARFQNPVDVIGTRLENLGIEVSEADSLPILSSAFDNGTLFMYYFGHGSSRNLDDGNDYDGWVDPLFTTKNFSDPLNPITVSDNEFPIIFSAACMGGWFDAEIDDFNMQANESFAEVITRLPLKGAVAAFGATRTSEYSVTLTMLEGAIDTIWPNADSTYHFSGIPSIGQVLYSAKQYLGSQNGLNREHTISHFQMWHLFGDPEMRIPKQVPTDMQADYPSDIGSSGPQSFFVNVTDSATELPINGAQVTLLQNGEEFSESESNDRGHAFFILNEPPAPGPMDISITHGEHKWFQETLQVSDLGANSSLLPTSGPRDSEFEINMTFYQANELVQIYLNGIPAGSVFVEQDGSIEKHVVSIDLPYQFEKDLPINVVIMGQSSSRASVVLFKGIPNEPDLCLYSQWDESTWEIENRGLDMPSYPKWDNPDIWVSLGSIDLARIDAYDPQIVGTHGLMNLLYTIKVRIYNEGPVDVTDANVSIEYSVFDIGQEDTWQGLTWTRAAVDGFDYRDVFFSWPVQQNNMDVSLRVNVSHPDDTNLGNNIGIENFAFFETTHIGPYQRAFPVHINNPDSRPISLYLRELQITSCDECWTAEYDISSDESLVIINIPSSIRCGDSHNFIIQGFEGSEHVEGMEIIVIKGWYTVPWLDQLGQWLVFTIIMGILVLTIALLIVGKEIWD